MSTVLLIGATGTFGSHIARALFDRDAMPRLLIRPGSRGKLAPDIADRSEVFEDPARAYDGVDCVISAVQGGPDVIIDTQLEFLRASRKAGVARFMPSDFSLNFFGLNEGENINSDWRRTFATQADEHGGAVDVVHTLQGCFLDVGVLFGFLGAVDLDKRQAYLWGSGNEPMQFTTYADTAAYTASAALDSQPVPSRFFVAGDSLNFHELVEAVSDGLGSAIAVKKLGELGDLDAEITRRQRELPSNLQARLPLMYWRGMLSGKGSLGPLHNARYPQINPVGVRAYVASIRA